MSTETAIANAVLEKVRDRHPNVGATVLSSDDGAELAWLGDNYVIRYVVIRLQRSFDRTFAEIKILARANKDAGSKFPRAAQRGDLLMEDQFGSFELLERQSRDHQIAMLTEKAESAWQQIARTKIDPARGFDPGKISLEDWGEE